MLSRLFAALMVCLAVGRAAEGLGWHEVAGGRAAAVAPQASATRPVGFNRLASQVTGIDFTNLVTQARFVTNQIYLNGAGVAAGDVDGDGWCDLYFCGIDRPNVLYRNLGGFRFEDITASAGVGLTNHCSTGAVFADVDGDGDLDLIVNSIGNGTVVLLNDGHGHFTNPDPGSPLNFLRGGMTLALADVDGNGTLDLYVANYRTTTMRDMPNMKLTINDRGDRLVVAAMNGRPTTDADLVGRFTVTRDQRIVENGEVDVLYLNDGRGHFTPVPFTGGAFLDEDGQPLKEPPYDWGLTAAFRDLNGDGAPDLYVCNDFESPDRIWLNDGHGHFRAAPRLALRSTSLFSMGVDFADINRDGFVDFFVSDMLSRNHARRMLETGEVQPTALPVGAIDNRPQYSHNTLFVNRGDGTWAELSQFAGVHASEWTWSPNFIDVDLDGYEDLLITTGHELQMMNGDIIQRAEDLKAQRQMSNAELQRLRTMFPRYAIPNVAFRNRGDLTFEDVSAAWGFDFPDVGNGVALADLDNDGDLDVVVNNLNGPAEVYRNEGTAPRVAVRLKGKAPNTQGIGAHLEVRGGPVPNQSQEVVSGGHYLSGHDPLRVFAAGSLTNRLAIDVRWRNGSHSVLTNVEPNQVVEIDEAGSQPGERPVVAVPSPLFEDATARLNHRHHEESFDDFARQPLLPRKLSQLGPGVAWADVDGDGREDLLLGSGKGGTLGLFHNEGDGTFRPVTDGAVARVVGRDLTGIVSVSGTVLVGSSNYEDGTTNGGSLRVFDLHRQATGESLLGQGITPGPLALADVDGDGGLDLFLGGRVVPGRYPEAASSVFLRKQGERFVVAQRFDKLGLVSGAVFSDLDGDGTPELVLACEWGPVRVFKWRAGAFTEITQALGLAGFTGWWTGVATGDLDGDGRPDLVVGNWGQNNEYRPTPERPVWLRYGDLSDNGAVDLIETFLDPTTGQEVPRRGYRSVLASFPFIQEQAATFEAYGKATIEQLLGARLKKSGRIEATTLQSMVFLNRGDHFEAHPLPPEAQWAPAYGVCVADFDGDGHEDVFLSQNCFAVHPEDWRQDAGRGLLLRGDGRGELTAVSGPESGIAVYGEQRGCAAADYDSDGRLDLVVTQNGNATRLFHNRGARPGLRVRLEGPPANATAIGAALRLRAGVRSGPQREIQAGSGYWSQSGAIQVMSTPEPATELWVRWPGGHETVSAVPAGAREISVGTDGLVRPVR